MFDVYDCMHCSVLGWRCGVLGGELVGWVWLVLVARARWIGRLGGPLVDGGWAFLVDVPLVCAHLSTFLRLSLVPSCAEM